MAAAVGDQLGELPPFSQSARDSVTSVDQLQGLLRAYHHPQSRMPGHSEGTERRHADGYLVIVDTSTGTVIYAGAHERSSTAPVSLQQRRTAKRRRRGGRGRTMPTTLKEAISRLKECGCTMDYDGPHIKVTLPNGHHEHLPKTPSDWRSLQNALSRIARHGIDLRRD